MVMTLQYNDWSLLPEPPRSSLPPASSEYNELIESLVVVTALSSNHFKESMDLFGTLHHFLPNNTIYVYDLGLKKKQIDFLNGLKNVQVIHYNFTAYPDFRDKRKFLFQPWSLGLGCYTWKFHILYELTKIHKVIAWFDASIRLLKPLTHNGCIQTLNEFPLSACSRHGRPMIEFATDTMLGYLKIKRENRMKELYGFESGCVFYKVTDALVPLLDKLKDCALHRECICGGYVDNWTTCMEVLGKGPPLGVEYLDGCHRYDQAALTLIASQLYGIDRVNQRVTPNCSEVFSIERSATNRYVHYLVKKKSTKLFD
jgi:hypothetical protein